MASLTATGLAVIARGSNHRLMRQFTKIKATESKIKN